MAKRRIVYGNLMLDDSVSNVVSSPQKKKNKARHYNIELEEIPSIDATSSRPKKQEKAPNRLYIDYSDVPLPPSQGEQGGNQHKPKEQNLIIRLYNGVPDGLEIYIDGQPKARVGETVQLSYRFNKEVDEDAVTFRWLSSNPQVAVIDETGTFEVLSAGETTITFEILDPQGEVVGSATMTFIGVVGGFTYRFNFYLS